MSQRKISMNKGTECLKQTLEIFQNMTVEEYEKLYDDVCELYGDSEIGIILC